MPVEKYLEGIDNRSFERAVIRNGVNGQVSAEYHVVPVWIVAENQPMELRLIIRRDLDGKVKYSLNNILKISILEQSRRQGQRIFVEQAFREGKNQLGIGDYQVRSWAGFHKHMALVFLGLYLVLKAKAMEGIPPTLTAADVVEVIHILSTSIYEDGYRKCLMRDIAHKCLKYYQLYCKAYQSPT